MGVTCYDIVSMFIDGVLDDNTYLNLNDDVIPNIKRVCELLDEMSDEFEAESFEADFIESSGMVEMTLEVPDFTVRDREHAFFELLDRCSSVRFEKLNEGIMKIVFSVGGVFKEKQ